MVNASSGERTSIQIVIFALDVARYALRLDTVERVVRMTAIAPLPKAPAVVQGLVNVRGKVVPVFAIRERFRLPVRPVQLSDQLIVARSTVRTVAIPVDRVLEIATCPAERAVPPISIFPGLDYVEGVIRQPDGLVFIHDLDTFLSAAESAGLDHALAAEVA